MRSPDHEWEAKVVDRAIGGNGCPCCLGRKLSITNSLATKYPELIDEWHQDKNGDLRPVFGKLNLIQRGNRKLIHP